MQAVNGHSPGGDMIFDLRHLIGTDAPFHRPGYFPNGNCKVAY
jgi:hypothetical protein